MRQILALKMEVSATREQSNLVPILASFHQAVLVVVCRALGSWAAYA